MTTVYIMRHGSYNQPRSSDVPSEAWTNGAFLDYGDLNSNGTNEITNSGLIIKNDLLDRGVKEVTIYHSPVNRVVQSAQVLARAISPISSRLEPRDELRSSKYKIRELIGEIGPVGIIVCHSQDMEDFTGQELATGEYRRIFR